MQYRLKLHKQGHAIVSAGNPLPMQGGDGEGFGHQEETGLYGPSRT